MELTRDSRGILTPAADDGAQCNPADSAEVRWADVDEHEHPAGPEAPGPSAAGAAPAVTEPAVTEPAVTEQVIPPERRRRGEGARKALTSRGAGWVVAAILAGAVVALSVVLATASSTVVLQPAGAARVRFFPAGGRTEILPPVPNGPVSWVQIPANAPPGSVRVEIPANAPPGISVTLPANAPPGAVRVQAPAVILPVGRRAQVRPGPWIEVPARVWIQVPAGVVSPAPAASPAKSAGH